MCTHKIWNILIGWPFPTFGVTIRNSCVCIRQYTFKQHTHTHTCDGFYVEKMGLHVTLQWIMCQPVIHLRSSSNPIDFIFQYKHHRQWNKCGISNSYCLSFLINFRKIQMITSKKWNKKTFLCLVWHAKKHDFVRINACVCSFVLATVVDLALSIWIFYCNQNCNEFL